MNRVGVVGYEEKIRCSRAGQSAANGRREWDHRKSARSTVHGERASCYRRQSRRARLRGKNVNGCTLDSHGFGAWPQFCGVGFVPHRSRQELPCGVARHGNGQISECQGRGEIRRAETPVGVHRVGIDRGRNAGGGQAWSRTNAVAPVGSSKMLKGSPQGSGLATLAAVGQVLAL